MMNQSNNEKFFIQYVRGNKNQKIGAIAVTVNVVTGMVNVGWSLCNPKDMFNTDLARKIAMGRMRSYVSIDPKDVRDQDELTSCMPDPVRNAWWYGGVYNRIMIILSNNGTRSNRVPVSHYVGNGPSHFENFSDEGANGDNARYGGDYNTSDSYYTNSSNDDHLDAGVD